MIRRYVTWQAILLTAVLLGGGGAAVFGQMTGARLPLQGVGIWGYDPNVGSFFSVRTDQDGTLIVSFLPGGGLASIIPGVGPSGFFLVSIYPAFGSLDRFLTSQVGLASVDTGRPVPLVSTMPFSPSTPVLTSQIALASVGGQVDVRGTGPGGSLLVSQWSGAGGGGGGTSTAQGLVSIASYPLSFQEVVGQALTSRVVIAGVTNQKIKVYGFDVSLASLGSVKIVCGCSNTQVLWSQISYVVGWGVSKPLAPSGTDAPEPFAYAELPFGAALVVTTEGNTTNVATWNFLGSQR